MSSRRRNVNFAHGSRDVASFQNTQHGTAWQTDEDNFNFLV